MLGDMSHGSWIVMGDLNDILDQSKAARDTVVIHTEESLLREFIERWNLIGLGFKGEWFTWINNRIIGV